DGDLYNVNAISGDMLKHIQAEHFFNLARQRGLPLCAGCRQFNPNRINSDSDFIARTRLLSDAETLDELLRVCAMDDIEGILITEGGRSIPRKSVVEFGWAIGLPETRDGHNQSFFHVKYATERSEGQRSKDATSRAKKAEGEGEGKTGGANLGQAIFHRPASSGQYAIVCHLEFGRIGYNDIRQQYALAPEERSRRGVAVLESLLHTFVQLNGAMRSAQLPHLVALEGAISYSTTILPAPLISPLAPDYAQQMAQVGKALGGGDGVTVEPFGSLGQFAELIHNLMASAQPYILAPA
ncbi:MAG TPA: DevR family CRISPR-associated autoregulator, partial [Roseiflexaceae bacterium]|nr:DevR family CRISPR-associated autoregulator [Roseiflexaceae bacterium]